jgi:acetyl esterase/lipase
MKRIFKVLVGMVAFVTFLNGLLRFYKIETTNGMKLSFPKMIAGAAAPVLASVGLLSALLAGILKAPVAMMVGAVGALLSMQHVKRVLAARGDWQGAFGEGWQSRIPSRLADRFMPARWMGMLPEPQGQARVDRDVPFWTIPEGQRVLLCDIWQPPEDVPPSGVALIYLHGSGWHYLDKDVGTRTMFAHLAAQGHVIMDVAYRLCPETDWRGMLGDTRRAVTWMKANAARYGADPARVVLSGGSAGGHLALLAAYTPDQKQLAPADVPGNDLSVRGVLAWYGVPDMAAYHENGKRVFGEIVQEPALPKPGELSIGDRMMKRMGFEIKPVTHWMPGETVQAEMMRALFGCPPSPEQFAEASPVSYTGPHCPPTLLLHGEHDSFVPIRSTRDLVEKLKKDGVPVVAVIYPETEHAFDLMLPKISPASQAALYEVERFLGLMAG